MEKFVSPETLKQAIEQLKGTAGPFFRIWLTLKRMGLSETKSVEITTSNATDALKDLFSCGDSEGQFYTPFAPTPSDLFMKGDASRSIIQTNIRQWLDGTGVKNPTKILAVSERQDPGRGKPLLVRTVRQYPQGLGNGVSGFASRENERVCVPILAFAIWWNRQRAIPPVESDSDYLIQSMLSDLNITSAESACVFIPGDEIYLTTRETKISDTELFMLVSGVAAGPKFEPLAVSETAEENKSKVHMRKTITDRPKWLNEAPEEQLRRLLASDAKAVLLSGAPRTGKTRAIDQLIPRQRPDRITIQIHDGWGYDQLIEGQIITDNGATEWSSGRLLKAIENNNIKHIVLEEVNRTLLTQSLGEVFSLIEAKYRGVENAIELRSGRRFWIPPDVTLYMTMNTIDKSTEEIDDALLGRLPHVDFAPRVEDLFGMLSAQRLEPRIIDTLCGLFSLIQKYYPLGHGYFADLKPAQHPIPYYVARVRPVLANHLAYSQPEALTHIDDYVDAGFSP